MPQFKLISKFRPTGDQPAAIEKLAQNLRAGAARQTLLGITGSGKTFTVANVIASEQKPTLVISHNKTLAAQLYQEFKEFFPDNAVHYFVSYYDYYQPEAYIPTTDTYIEKDAKINEVIDGLRHASTASLLTRKDVIIVASVSCIYGLGSPEEYDRVALELKTGDGWNLKEIIKRLILLQYTRNPLDPRQGHFRIRENTVEIHLPSGEEILQIEIEKGRIASIKKRKTSLQATNYKLQAIRIFPAKHFVTPQIKLKLAVENIKKELKDRLAYLKKEGRVLEEARLKQRTEYDMEMLQSMGYVNGIENYSRQLDFREPGTPPFTLLDYFHYAYNKPSSRASSSERGDLLKKVASASPRNDNDPGFLTVIDESHATVPQLKGMYNGDLARKNTLVEYGFRLPSARDNRPLKFEEFNKKIGQTIYVSATPADYELRLSNYPSLRRPSEERGSTESSRTNVGGRRPTWQSQTQRLPRSLQSLAMTKNIRDDDFVVEQLIRPTGILDPKIVIHPVKNQLKHLIAEIKSRIAKKERSLVITLTKRLAEDVSEYLVREGIKAEYMHSEIKTFERSEILKKLREGEHDVIVGINLLREGLDLPEVSFIAILDADKEGFLRNRTTLLQIIGRAARHTDGEVVLYADVMTASIKAAVRETERRRYAQERYNQEHGITPQQIEKAIRKSIMEDSRKEKDILLPEGPQKEVVKELERQMKKASKNMDFELAAKIRDKINQLKK